MPDFWVHSGIIIASLGSFPISILTSQIYNYPNVMNIKLGIFSILVSLYFLSLIKAHLCIKYRPSY